MLKSTLTKVLFVCFFLLIFTISAFAEYFYIKNYNIDVNITNTSLLEIEETIKVYFNTKRHGIFRTIPYRYLVNIDSNYEKAHRPFLDGKYYKIDIFDVKVDGFKYVTYKKGDKFYIKIGDKNSYVSGDVTYKIKYKIFGAINFFKEHSEFYYNIIGTEWPVKIEETTFNIYFPENYLPSENDIIFAGSKFGERKKIANYNVGEGFITGFTSRALKPFEGLTIVIKFPKNFLMNGTAFLKVKLFIINNIVYLTPIIIFVTMFLIWFFIGRDKNIIKYVQYMPPKDMTPAEAGVIIDDKTDNKDLISLIFFWAVNGIILIEEDEQEGIFTSRDDYILTKIKDLPENAKRYEKTIFNGLFPANKQAVRISTLKNNFYTYMQDARKELDEEIKKNNYYVSGTRILGNIFKKISIFVLLIGIFYSFFASRIDYIMVFIINALIIFIFGYIMPKKTDKGIDSYLKVKGFKDFINRVEAPKLKVLLKKYPNYFDKTLPYAIAFNEEKVWAEKFKSLIIEPPSWYISKHQGQFNTIYFTNSLSNATKNMNQVFNSILQSAGSGGSGFSSGGGFSGGGFGGGGGGSW